MSSADWIDDLEREARAATPGPWSADGYGSGQQVTGAAGTIFADTLAFHEDAKFIAAANPTTILRLIGEVHRWKAAWEMASPLLTERDELAAKVARVEALADETEQAGDPLLRLDHLRAALSAAPTDTTKET